jgi:hypothetical protein
VLNIRIPSITGEVKGRIRALIIDEFNEDLS